MILFVNNARCPNPDCLCHKNEAFKRQERWYKFHGYYHTKKGNIPRYKCRYCGKTFSLTCYSEKNNGRISYDCRKLCELYKNGMDLNELSKEYQISPEILFRDIETFI